MNARAPAELVSIGAGMAVFLVVVMSVVALVLLVRRALAQGGEAEITVNGRTIARVARGVRLLTALADRGVPLPAACGGIGACGLCRVLVVAGGGPILPTETSRLTRADVARGARLACQVTVREDIALDLPEELLGVQEFTCVVRSSRSVATFMKEIVLEVPEGFDLEFRAGAFVLLQCPPFRASFRDFEIAAEFRDAWDRNDLWRLSVRSDEPTARAYSLANSPGEAGIVQLVVRIATPPPGARADVPPGIVSSYVFGLSAGDLVTVTGPFGNFMATESEREMIFVGGGAGMAPMRSHVLDQLQRLRTSRKIGFWYGARSRRELFYDDLFERLAAEHDNFTWTVALSEPRPEDDWHGPVGYIHRVLDERYLRAHRRPDECDYYLCGPPLMIRATRQLLDELGVPPENVHFDDFGGQ